MIPARETSVSVSALCTLNAELVRLLHGGLAAHSTTRTIEKGTSIACRDGTVVLVTAGTLCLENKGKAVAWFAEKELVGRWFGLSVDARLRSIDADVVIDECPYSDFITCMASQPSILSVWQSYLEESAAVMAELFAEHGVLGDIPTPVLSQFKAGQPIIIEGSTGEHVFTLIEGKADVFASGQKVGEIPMNQIFGAAAALTGQPRSASVIAKEDCLAMRFDRITFREMLRSHPELVIKLVEDMAASLKEMNTKIVAMREMHH